MERNQQVLKMKDIYANASHVFVWLGEEDEYTRPALELLITLGSKDLDVLREVDPLSPWAETKPRTREVLGLSIEEGDWKALAYFYRRAWFSRVWILQEVRMAQRTVYYCGNYNVSMDNLFHVAAYIERSYWAPAKGFTMNDGTSPYERPSVLSTRHALLVLYHIFYREYNFGSRLATAIMNGRASHSSDPRDKVYGLLGFFEGSLEEREFCKLMSPDYRKSISQIYVEAAEYILKSMGDLLILSFVEDRLYRSTEGLPSWVPDFSVQGATGVGYTKRTTYRASRDLPAVWQKNASMALILKASQIDVISDTGESKFELVNEYRCVRLLRIIVEMNDYYFNGQTIVEALWRTLIEDCGSHLARTKYESPAPKTFEVAFKSFWLSNAALWLLRPGQVENRENIFDTDIFISGLLLQLAQKDTCGVLPGLEEIVNFARHAGLAHFAEVVNDEYEQQVKTADPYSVAFNQTSWLRFFCTEGKLMGMGPFSLQVGDSIWLVPGSEVLIVLRKGSGANRYELVGDCYVHGLMGGEAVDEALPRMQTIELE
ncbi:MAG: hypothetical protein L6R41_004543 [Letrouitia leprolyta]|nr:MAG: hypothetical protein L6R41_004543 [Letrouitia leprolyta]